MLCQKLIEESLLLFPVRCVSCLGNGVCFSQRCHRRRGAPHHGQDAWRDTHSLSTHSHGIRRIPGEDVQDVEASRVLPWQRELRNSPDLRTNANVKTARVVLKGATSKLNPFHFKCSGQCRNSRHAGAQNHLPGTPLPNSDSSQHLPNSLWCRTWAKSGLTTSTNLFSF